MFWLLKIRTLVLNAPTYFLLALGNNRMQSLKACLRDSFLHCGTLKPEENILAEWRDWWWWERGQGVLGRHAVGSLCQALWGSCSEGENGESWARWADTGESSLNTAGPILWSVLAGWCWARSSKQVWSKGHSVHSRRWASVLIALSAGWGCNNSNESPLLKKSLKSVKSTKSCPLNVSCAPLCPASWQRLCRIYL